MIAAALALLIMSADRVLTRTEGALLLLGAVFYTIALVRLSSIERPEVRREFSDMFGAGGDAAAGRGRTRSAQDAPASAGAEVRRARGRRADAVSNALLLAAGMAITVLGAELLVAGAVQIARSHGVSDAFVGLTIVAIGTSAPELATTLVATVRNDRDVAIGNLIGSSIYNVLVILGLTMLAAPNGVAVDREILWIDLPLAALVPLVCLPVFKSDRRVSRIEGGLFVTAYAAYLTTLVLLRT